MSDLQFVAFSDDGKAVILQNAAGEWIEVPITDSRALEAQQSLTPIRAVSLEPEHLSPREIQARIRAGATAEGLAAESGVSLDRIMMFAPPIVMERKHVASKAMKTIVRRANGSGPLAEVVNARLEPLGVDPLTHNWDSFRREDGRWTVTLSYPTAEGDRQAAWLFDVRNAALVPADDEARWLIGEPLPKGSQSHPEHPTLVVPHLSVVKPTEAAPVASDPVEPTANSESEGLFSDSALVEDPTSQLADDSSAAGSAAERDSEEDAAEADAFDLLTRPEPSEKRRSKLPSWDEILFGKSDN